MKIGKMEIEPNGVCVYTRLVIHSKMFYFQYMHIQLVQYHIAIRYNCIFRPIIHE